MVQLTKQHYGERKKASFFKDILQRYYLHSMLCLKTQLESLPPPPFAYLSRP